MSGADQFQRSATDPGLSVSIVGRRMRPDKQRNIALACYAAAGAAVAGGVPARTWFFAFLSCSPRRPAWIQADEGGHRLTEFRRPRPEE